MNLERLREDTQAQMPALRWQHTLGVIDSAVELAQRFGGDVQKAELAALLHDYCKYWPIAEQRSEYAAAGLDPDLLRYDPQLLHGPLAAEIVRSRYGIEDAEVLDAIRYHTSGREKMTLLDKIICLADYIEPGRDFPGVHNIRESAEHSLEGALVAGFDSTIQFLLSKGKKIYPQAVVARNALIEENRSGKGNADETNA
ncbi:bis(5'-nucleosyl)-tetraphosphatase (symmetrical) YqeK [Paenibacillus hodogayensis]|uniref:bis(5'-nucleosyl)-tetraphosphatase (symmetrical) n=1 Tax=Paenibacillus hodogayensis TaxID=279208 RepID=A0ABV5VUS5_9BACL